MSHTKILLLQPPITLKREDIKTFGIFPPLGLAYLAAVLLKAGFHAEIKDLLAEGIEYKEDIGDGHILWGLPKSDIEQMLCKFSPAIVGISNNFSSFTPDSMRLAKIVREILPEAWIIMGGSHASMEPLSILKENTVNAVVIGEGEYVFKEIVQCISERRIDDVYKIPGTIWTKEKTIIDNGYPGPIADIDCLPFPAYHLMPMEKYIWQKKANFAVAMRYPVGHMITSRGCLYNCIFCSTRKHFKKYRVRSPENVIAEIELLIHNYGIREFHFHDDCFMAKLKNVKALCELILKKKLDIRWQVSQGINSVSLSEELLKLMYKSGMYRVGFPIESGCKEILKFIRKPVKLEKVARLIEVCNYLGIYTFGCFMIGFPNETKRQVIETMVFLLNSGLDYVKISVVQPFPGSDLYSIYKQQGLLEQGLKHTSTYFNTEYDTSHMKAQELNALRAYGMRAFFRKRILRMLTWSGMRQYLFPKLRSSENIKYFIRMAWHSLLGL